jgi:ABC-type Fe3+-siderophore transport system permease subunit
LDKWVLLINSFSDSYLTGVSKRARHACNLTIIFLMLFSIFGHELNKEMIIFAIINIATVYFLGENKKIQNNYLVHFLTISFTSFSTAAQLKYSLFK